MANVKDTVIVEFRADTKNIDRDISKVEKSIKGVDNEANKASKSISGTRDSILSLIKAAGGIALVQETIRMADSYKNMEAQIRIVSKSTNELAEAQKEVFSISQITRTGIEETTKLYTKLSTAMSHMGKTQKETLFTTELISKAIKVSGATTEEAASTVLQFSQAMASTKLQGDEYRSLMENSPYLMKKMAEGIGVPIGALKDMATEGELTSEVVINAINKMSASIEGDFGKMPITIGQSFTMIQNSISKLIGEADKAFGASGSIASAMGSFANAISDNISTFVHIVGSIVGVTLAWKAQSLIVNPLIGAYKSLEIGATSLTGKYVALSFGLKTLFTTVKSFALANLPFLALTAAFEAWNYATGQSADRLEKLNSLLSLTTVEAVKLTKAQQQNNVSILDASLVKHREIARELLTEARLQERKNGLKSQEAIAARAAYDAQVATTREIGIQRQNMQDVLTGVINASNATQDMANSASSIPPILADAANEAFKLSSALGSAIVGMDTQLIKAQELAGKISETQSVTMVADVGLKDIDNQMAGLNALYEAQGANIDELNVKAIETYTNQLSIQNGLAESLKSIEDKKTREAEAAAKKIEAANKAAGKSALKSSKDSVKALNDELRKAEELQRKYLELSGDKQGLFIFDVDKQLNELIKSGQFTAEEISKAYDGMYKDYVDSGKDANKEIALDFTQQFEGLFQGLINGDLGSAVKGLFSGISMELSKGLVSSLSKSLTSSIGTLFSGLGELGTGIIGLGIGLLGSLFGGNKEQTPPVLDDLAKTSDSMANSLDYIKNAQNPMLKLTREMTGYLSAISKAFGGIENSLLRSGLDLGGASYQGTAKAGFLGLTSKSTELFGTSIQVGATTLSGIMNGWINATLLETTKTVKKGIFKSSTTYNTTGKDISTQLASYLDEAVTAAFQSLTISGEALGISTAGLANQSINIGSFDTTGMSASEVAAQIESRFSAQMDAIAESYFGVVSEFQLAGEGLAETLYRVTVNFEQVGHSLGLIDKVVNWRTANIIADYAGGIDALNSSLSSYTQNFFTEQEQYAMQVETMTKNFASLGVVMPTTNSEFRKLVEGFDTTTDEGAKLFSEVIGLSDAFNEMTSAAEESSDAITKMIKDVSDAWLGNLSYLTLKQKADYASGYLSIASSSNGAIDMVEAARLAAETALKTTSTREEYIPVFDRYIKELEAQEPISTLDDVVYELNDLKTRVVSSLDNLEETTRRLG